MKHNGFTLLEILITLSIAAALMAIGIPSFSDMIDRSRLSSYTNELTSSIVLARTQAITTNKNVVIAKNGVNWEDGYIVFIDYIDDGGNKNVFNGIVESNSCEASIISTDPYIISHMEDCLLRIVKDINTSFSIRSLNDFITFSPENGELDSLSMPGVNEVLIGLCLNRDGDFVPEPNLSRLIRINNAGRNSLSDVAMTSCVPPFI